MNEVIEHNEQSFFVTGDAVFNLGKALKTKPRRVKDPELGQSNIIKYWGTANNYPQWVLEQIKDVTLVEPILDWKARALYSGGLVYGIESIDANGQESFRRIIDNEIEDWLSQTDINRYLRQASIQHYTFYNFFPELTQSRSGKYITYLSLQDATNVRYRRKNQQGIIKRAYISPDWEQFGLNDKSVFSLPLFDHFHTDLKNWKTKGDQQFILPMSAHTPGRAYYNKAPWHVILDTWLPIARAIPEFKKALLKNQLTIKYLIKVPEWWWEWKYKDWHSKNAKERLKIITTEKETFESFFKGKQQGNSMMYTQRDSTPAKTYGDWSIEVLDDKLKTGMYIEDSQEADAHIFKNMGVDSTLFGAGTGKDRSGAGSGSDKRVAWNNYMILTKPHQDQILHPLHFISKWNGWNNRLAKKQNERLTWTFKNHLIAKLDSGAETTESK